MLAPLDQDLSYSWPEFVNIMKEDEFYTKHDRVLFDSWLNSERHAMEEGLTGASNMSNFEYYTHAEAKPESKGRVDLAGLVELGLRELMVKEFRNAFDKKSQLKDLEAEEGGVLEKWVRRALEAAIGEVAS